MRLKEITEAKYYRDAETIFNKSIKDSSKRGLYMNLLGRMDSGMRTYAEIVNLFDIVANRYETNLTNDEKEVFLRILKKNAPKSAF